VKKRKIRRGRIIDKGLVPDTDESDSNEETADKSG
jgi:hypothetical protein